MAEERREPKFTGQENDYARLEAHFKKCSQQILKLKMAGCGTRHEQEKLAKLEAAKLKISHGLNIFQPMSTKKTTFV